MENLSADELVELAGILAHDSISELAVADAAIDLMMHDDAVPLEIRGKLSLLIEQVRRAAMPAKRFIMRSRTKGFVQVADPNSVLSGISQLLRRLLPKNINFQVDLAADLWPIKVNVDHFQDALLTLVMRARHALPNGGALLIRATNVEGHTSNSTGLLSRDRVSVEIIDNGFCIPAADLQQIFSPFFITKSPLSGFAMARVFGTVADAGGRILVTSEVDKGTTFTTLVPRYVADVAAA
jgi:two-component system cell cycle sensor histidine kinase/response regulator CckA